MEQTDWAELGQSNISCSCSKGVGGGGGGGGGGGVYRLGVCMK